MDEEGRGWPTNSLSALQNVKGRIMARQQVAASFERFSWFLEVVFLSCVSVSHFGLYKASKRATKYFRAVATSTTVLTVVITDSR